MNGDKLQRNGSVSSTEIDVEGQTVVVDETKITEALPEKGSADYDGSSSSFLPSFFQSVIDKLPVATTTNTAKALSESKRRLRSREPDLKIIIGRKKEVRWCHSAILANHSGFIDTMLSSPMREGQTNEIHLPDITPAKWDAMLKYIEDPAEARKMTVNDVLTLGREYDMYDIIKGRELCSQVLAEYFQRKKEFESKASIYSASRSLNVVIDAIVLAFDANLDGVGKEEGMKYLREKLKLKRTPFNRNMFTEKHIKRIVPILVSTEDPEIGWEKEVINSPEFPHLFVTKDPVERDNMGIFVMTMLVVTVVAFVLLFGGFLNK